MKQLASYVSGSWVRGSAKPSVLVNPAPEELLADGSTESLDFASAFGHAREVGGKALRALSFAQCGSRLWSVAAWDIYMRCFVEV